jgi:hypothetical protein
MVSLRGGAARAVNAETNTPHVGSRKARNSDESFGGIGIPSMFGAISEQPDAPARARNKLGWWWHTPHDLLDKVDEANLVRDTRVLVHACWSLLTDAVLPLDHAATAETLLAELAPLATKLGERFPIAGLVTLAERVRDAARRMAASAGDPVAASAALMRASRCLVPADYTTGDRFTHDAALPLPPWAVLAPLRALAATTPGSDAEKFAEVDARAARNRLAFALREAQNALNAALAALN